MEQIILILRTLVSIIESDPLIVLVIFLLSLVANIIQVFSFLDERKRYVEEKAQRKKLLTLVETYEDLLEFVKEKADNDEELEALKRDIENKSEIREELLSKIEQLENLAKKRVVDQAIERNVYILNQALEEIERLKQESAEVGEISSLPQEKLAQLRREVDLSIVSKYELPKEFLYQSVLIFFIIWFAPDPLDSLILPFLLKALLTVFFEAIFLFKNESLHQFVKRYFGVIILVSSIGAWSGFFLALSSLVTLLIPIVNLTFASVLTYPLALIFSFKNWKRLKQDLKYILNMQRT